jgi:tRNA (guanine37-N1)-methyltransferase
VVTGGELPALVVIDAVIRLLPGAIEALSTTEESFAGGLLEYPQYTRPPSFRGMDVPAILTSGDHGAVARWRREQALERTLQRRPDLLPERPSRDAPAAPGARRQAKRPGPDTP